MSADYDRLELLRGQWCEFRVRLSWKANKYIADAHNTGAAMSDAFEKAVLADVNSWSFGDEVDMEKVDMDSDQMNTMVAHLISLYGLDTEDELGSEDEKKA